MLDFNKLIDDYVDMWKKNKKNAIICTIALIIFFVTFIFGIFSQLESLLVIVTLFLVFFGEKFSDEWFRNTATTNELVAYQYSTCANLLFRILDDVGICRALHIIKPETTMDILDASETVKQIGEFQCYIFTATVASTTQPLDYHRIVQTLNKRLAIMYKLGKVPNTGVNSAFHSYFKVFDAQINPTNSQELEICFTVIDSPEKENMLQQIQNNRLKTKKKPVIPKQKDDDF